MYCLDQAPQPTVRDLDEGNAMSWKTVFLGLAKTEKDACRGLAHPERLEKGEQATLYSQCPTKGLPRRRAAVALGYGFCLSVTDSRSSDPR